MMKRAVITAGKYIQLSFKMMFQYKFDRFFILFAVMLREAGNVLVIVLLLQRFIEIKGWTMDEILFLYSFLFISYSIFVLFFTGIRDFEELVYSGELDRYLLRPQGILYQVLLSRIDIPAALGYGILGAALLFVTSKNVHMIWTLPNILYYIVMLVTGLMIQASIFLFTAALSFWAVKVTNIRNLIFFNIRKCAAYPLSFYPAFIQTVLIYFVPFAFVDYFPALFYLKKEEAAQYSAVYFYIGPLVAAVLFLTMLAFWDKSRSRYMSTGTQL